MKRTTFNKILLLTIISFFAMLPATRACDICGGGLGGHYTGLLPSFSKKIIGLRYRYNSLQTHVSPGGTSTYLTTREKFYITEVWGAWNINPKFKLMANLPYNHITKENQSTVVSKSGVGDPVLQCFYQLFQHNANQEKNAKGTWEQVLWLGGGIKLPLGYYDKQAKLATNTSINTFQLGTGSTDLLASLMYDARLQQSGVNITASYKWNLQNQAAYRYGNNFSVNTQFYHRISFNQKTTLVPNVGFNYEHAAKDQDNKYIVDVSGGNMLLGTIGLEATRKKWAIGVNYQKPMHQKLANGFVQASNRMMCHVAFLF